MAPVSSNGKSVTSTDGEGIPTIQRRAGHPLNRGASGRDDRERDATRVPSRRTTVVMLIALTTAAVLYGGVRYQDRVVETWDSAAELFAQIGLDDQAATRGFEVRNVEQSTFIENDQTVVVVTGEIVNISGRTRDVPKIIAEILDKDSRVIDSWLVTPADSSLAPGESTAFSDRFTDPPKNAVQLMVRLEGGG